MSSQLADAMLIDPLTAREAVQHPAASLGNVEDGQEIRVARGIMTAMLISAPFWALVGFTVYLVL